MAQYALGKRSTMWNNQYRTVWYGWSIYFRVGPQLSGTRSGGMTLYGNILSPDLVPESCTATFSCRCMCKRKIIQSVLQWQPPKTSRWRTALLQKSLKYIYIC